MTQAAPSSGPSPWFGQPRGLTVLFLTNMWEQFSYYGMRAILVFYMTKQLLIRQESASTIYGLYTAAAYFTPIAGGIIADRYLGKRRAIVLGGAIMAVGHVMMTAEPLFYPALATIAIGNGLFLPTLPSQIDDLYAPGDRRVAWAYNVYYVGINVGGLLAPLICGTLGEAYGWHWGFGAAGIGMIAGLAIYLGGGRYLPAQERRVAVEVDSAPGRMGARTMLVLAGIALGVIVFRGAYEQIGNTVALWADTGVDKRIGGSAIPMTWFVSLNPLFVMAMTPLLLVWWRRRAEAGRGDAPARRMATGALIVGGAYLLLALVAWQAGGARVHWAWLALFFAVFTFGELFVLPTGLGLFARLAPPGRGATTVAAWYATIAAGSLFAGTVGRWWSGTSPAVYFAALVGLCLAAAALLRLLDRPLHAVAPVVSPDATSTEIPA